MSEAQTTPGVYVGSVAGFPPAVVGVATAVPAFIGYTETAEVNGKPVLLKPIRVTSLAGFEEVFGGAHRRPYQLVPVASGSGDVQAVDPATGASASYALEAAGPRFGLYDSVRLFYANGGGDCYVISAGTYEDAEGGTRPVMEADLAAGLAAAGEQAGVTMLVIPDAVELPPDDPAVPWVCSGFATLTQAMLRQCNALQDRVAILDVYGTPSIAAPGAALQQVVDTFRVDVGGQGLSYGMAYFPFVNTTIVGPTEIDYRWITDTSAAQQALLGQILTWQNQALYGDPANPSVPTQRQTEVQAQIDSLADAADPTALNAELAAALPLLGQIEGVIAQRQSVLPPSGAMAGVFTYVDSTRGVWNAPANVTLTAVAGPTLAIDSDQQDALTVPPDGKALDVLRAFAGRGTVVWGARTLDGNSNDYRYVQVRRTVIFIEQSIKAALAPFVFAPNTGQTWSTAVAMVSSFLQQVWSQGGLMGATPSDAFSVQCGLGSTMTAQDVMDGYMIVQVMVQLIRPAEFIELTFKQKMEGVS